MLKNKKTLVILLILLPQFLSASVRLHGAFTNHMVIQQKTKAPVWGWASPNESITVKGSWGEVAETTAKADSSWMVYLKTPKAGGPFTITVTGDNTLVIDDVLAGEVWLCTGQSNMDFEMYRFLNDSREKKYQPLVEEIRNEVATANDPWIRHLEVPRTPSMHARKRDFKANWRMAIKGNVDTITAIGYYFAKELRKHLNVPVGLVECAWGGSRIQPWIAEEVYMQNERMKTFYLEDRKILEARIKAMETPGWQDTAYQRKQKLWLSDKTKYGRAWPTEHPEKSKQTPSTIYNGMVSAIKPYAVKGVLWYQGESNSHFMEEQYGDYFKAMIKSWREDWDNNKLPFYWAQLASYHQNDLRSNEGWATVNDHLRRSMELPKTGMAVLCDIGEAKDVHPHNKMDAGKRLALWALSKDYKIKVAAYSGPLYKSQKIKGNKVWLTFSNVESGLMVANKHLNEKPVATEQPLRWFEVSDENGVWKSADAKIISPNKIEVYCPEVSHPKYVRYAWSSNPEGVNLYNKEGLPAAVFSTTE